MLHRLSLRVLPQLNAVVTDQPVRKKKRIVMLIPGLVAFGVYHFIKPFVPISEPFVLLGFSGCISMIAALWAYRQGRGSTLRESFRQDGLQRWLWVVGWIGLVYGIQLSLLVLAILRVFVGYDFLLHPEGPAMMAIIISSTSVTRDAFEIGHVQKLIRQGAMIPTYPDGRAMWNWMPQGRVAIVKWAVPAILMGVAVSWGLSRVGPIAWQPVMQSLLVPVIIASTALMSFYAGEVLFRDNIEKNEFRPRPWLSSLWFWVWPSLTFSVTYFLVLMGMAAFVFRLEQIPEAGFAAMTAGIAVLMTVYTLYLGWRKAYEEQLGNIPDSLQKCPFVMGILQNTKNSSPSMVEANAGHGDLVK